MGGKTSVINTSNMKSGVRYVIKSVKNGSLIKRGSIIIKRKGSVIHNYQGFLLGSQLDQIVAIEVDHQHYALQSKILEQRMLEAAYMTHGD